MQEGAAWHTFDLTSEQFGDEVLDYTDNPVQSRDEHFSKEEKRERYEYLKKALQEWCSGAEAFSAG